MVAAGSVTVRSAQAVRVRRGTARFGKSRRSRLGVFCHGKSRLGTARRSRCGAAGRGAARRGTARRSCPGWVRNVEMGFGTAVKVRPDTFGLGVVR